MLCASALVRSIQHGSCFKAALDWSHVPLSGLSRRGCSTGDFRARFCASASAISFAFAILGMWPGSKSRGYGFRVRGLQPRPGMTAEIDIDRLSL